MSGNAIRLFKQELNQRCFEFFFFTAFYGLLLQ